MLTASLTEDQIIDSIADFLEPVIGNCFKSQINRVPTESGQFAMLTPLRFTRISTTKSKKAIMNPEQYIGGADGFNTFNNGVFFADYNGEGLTEVRQMDLQVDIYGDDAAGRAVALETVWASAYAYDSLKDINDAIAPLYSSEAIQAPFIDESKQWLERYIVTLSLQVHITITVGQKYFNTVELTTERV